MELASAGRVKPNGSRVQVYGALRETVKTLLDFVVLVVCGHDSNGEDDEPISIPEELRTELPQCTSGHSGNVPNGSGGRDCAHEGGASMRRASLHATGQSSGATSLDATTSKGASAASKDAQHQNAHSCKPLLISLIVQKCSQLIATLFREQFDDVESDRMLELLPDLARLALRPGDPSSTPVATSLDDSMNYLTSFGDFVAVVHSAVCKHITAEQAGVAGPGKWRDVCVVPEVLAALAAYLSYTVSTVVLPLEGKQDPVILEDCMATHLQTVCDVLAIAVAYASDDARDGATRLLLTCRAGGLLNFEARPPGHKDESCISLIVEETFRIVLAVKKVLGRMTASEEECSSLAPVALVVAVGQLLAVCMKAQAAAELVTGQLEKAVTCLIECVRFAAALHLADDKNGAAAFLRLPEAWWPVEQATAFLSLALRTSAEDELHRMLKRTLQLCTDVKSCCAADGEVRRHIRESSWVAESCPGGQVGSLLDQLACKPAALQLAHSVSHLCR
jgi:hypothetical protein